MSKRRVKKIIMHKRPPPSKLEGRMDDLYKAQSVTEERLSAFINDAVPKMNAVIAQLRELLTSIVGIDRNVMVTVGIVKELLGQVSLLDAELKLINPVDGKSLEERVDMAAVVDQAKKWYKDLEQQGFRELARQAEERQKLIEKEKAEKTEGQVAQATLTEAETPALVAPTTGPGSDFPEGAQIFGG